MEEQKNEGLSERQESVHFDQGDQVARRSVFMMWQNYVIIGLLLLMYLGGSENARLNKEANLNADQNAVLRSKIEWLWHSHNVFKAVIESDKSRLMRGGAWEFAKTNWKQSELDFVESHFDKIDTVNEVGLTQRHKNRPQSHWRRSIIAERDSLKSELAAKTAEHKNSRLFMFSLFWDSAEDFNNVILEDLPRSWADEYPRTIERLKEIGATNVLARLDTIDRALKRTPMAQDHSLGSGQ